MGAIQDKSVSTKFHFGNALVDLDHLIPRGDEVEFVAFPQSAPANETQLRLHDLSLKIAELADVQSQLSFALRDIKRSFKK